MKLVPLTKGNFAKVDDVDFEYLKKRTWYFTPQGYAKCSNYPNTPKLLSMHRLIVGAPEGVDVDHINGDKLDNRRCNLRLCSRKDNLRNIPPRRNSKSPFKGICFDPKREKWRARIQVDNKGIHLGRFFDPRTAALIYDKAAEKYFGAFAYLNYPPRHLNTD